MAITTNIPPQAYTRDTLVQAIEWMATQPPAVRERASSADLIVSFYLQARRRMTAAQLEAPVSGENFKQDLKHLALDLKQFEEPSAAPPPMPNRALSHGHYESSPQVVETPPSVHSHHNHLHTAPAAHAVAHSHAQQHAQQHVHLHVQSTPPAVHHAPPVAHSAMSTKGPTWAVDARSMECARELQKRLNLGSETEALRMLVTLGMERAREMFPD